MTRDATHYDAYDAMQRGAYHNLDAEGYSAVSEGCPCMVQSDAYPDDFGSPGTVQNVGGNLICVPSSKLSADDRALITEKAHRLYDGAIQSAWKAPR
jgi:hypothetical protein